MSHRELVVLGTASQVPTRFRNHNGYLLLWDGSGILFDPGEGTQRQMTLAGVRAHQLTHVAITHLHGDHCLGLPGVLQRIHLDAVPHPVDVHHPASGQVYVDRLANASIHTKTADVRFHGHGEAGPVGGGEGWTLSVARLAHRTDCWGFRVQEDDGWRVDPERLRATGLRGPAVGALLRDGEVTHEGRTLRVDEVAERRPGQAVAFVMDTKPCRGALELARDADLLVIESTYRREHAAEARAHGHLTAEQAARIATEAGARQLVLTHFSQRYPRDQGFADEAATVFDGPIVQAVDLLRVPVPPRRTA